MCKFQFQRGKNGIFFIKSNNGMNLKLWKFGDLKTEVTLHVHNVSTQMDTETSSSIQAAISTLKICLVMDMILINYSVVWSHLLLTVRLMREHQYSLILGLVEDLSYMGTWMNREPLSMLYGLNNVVPLMLDVLSLPIYSPNVFQGYGWFTIQLCMLLEHMFYIRVMCWFSDLIAFINLCHWSGFACLPESWTLLMFTKECSYIQCNGYLVVISFDWWPPLGRNSSTINSICSRFFFGSIVFQIFFIFVILCITIDDQYHMSRAYISNKFGWDWFNLLLTRSKNNPIFSLFLLPLRCIACKLHCFFFYFWRS